MAVVADGERFRVCEKCGASYPVQYGGCPHCLERTSNVWKIATVVVVALVALYLVARLSGVVTVLASRF